MQPPSISVIVPARNASATLDEAVESILAQTFQDFEMVLLDDASSDCTWERMQSWSVREPRIRIFRSDQRLGPAGSSQFVADQARGQWLARQDADDRSHPQRLARQWAVWKRWPETVAVGTLYEAFDGSGQVIRPRDRSKLLRPALYNPCPHGSLMFTREALRKSGGYRSQCDYWEDQDFLIRLAALGPVRVVTEALYQQRILPREWDPARLAIQRRAAECLARAARGEDYQHLLDRPLPQGPWTNDCWACYAAHIPRFWAGQPPGLWQCLWREAAYPRDLRQALIWQIAALAELAPGPTRALLGRAIAVLDWWAGHRLGGAEVVEIRHPWRGVSGS